MMYFNPALLHKVAEDAPEEEKISPELAEQIKKLDPAFVEWLKQHGMSPVKYFQLEPKMQLTYLGQFRTEQMPKASDDELTWINRNYGITPDAFANLSPSVQVQYRNAYRRANPEHEGLFGEASSSFTGAIGDLTSWFSGQGDASQAAGSRAIAYFAPRLLGALGFGAVASMLAGRRGGMMVPLLGALAGFVVSGPIMDMLNNKFGKVKPVKELEDPFEDLNRLEEDPTQKPLSKEEVEAVAGELSKDQVAEYVGQLDEKTRTEMTEMGMLTEEQLAFMGKSKEEQEAILKTMRSGMYLNEICNKLTSDQQQAIKARFNLPDDKVPKTLEDLANMIPINPETGEPAMSIDSIVPLSEEQANLLNDGGERIELIRASRSLQGALKLNEVQNNYNRADPTKRAEIRQTVADTKTLQQRREAYFKANLSGDNAVPEGMRLMDDKQRQTYIDALNGLRGKPGINGQSPTAQVTMPDGTVRTMTAQELQNALGADAATRAFYGRMDMGLAQLDEKVTYEQRQWTPENSKNLSFSAPDATYGIDASTIEGQQELAALFGTDDDNLGEINDQNMRQVLDAYNTLYHSSGADPGSVTNLDPNLKRIAERLHTVYNQKRATNSVWGNIRATFTPDEKISMDRLKKDRDYWRANHPMQRTIRTKMGLDEYGDKRTAFFNKEWEAYRKEMKEKYGIEISDADLPKWQETLRNAYHEPRPPTPTPAPGAGSSSSSSSSSGTGTGSNSGNPGNAGGASGASGADDAGGGAGSNATARNNINFDPFRPIDPGAASTPRKEEGLLA